MKPENIEKIKDKKFEEFLDGNKMFEELCNDDVGRKILQFFYSQGWVDCLVHTTKSLLVKTDGK